MPRDLPENTRLLVICPSRGRPDRVMDMLKSFYETRSAGTEICIVVSVDDLRFGEYEKNLTGENLIVCESRFTPDKTNYVAAKLYPDLSYYGLVDDDQIFRTPGWDIKFIQEIEKHKGWGLCCGKDLFNADWYQYKHPNGFIVSGNFVKLFGYLIYPKFQHVGIDHWQADLFGHAGCLFHLPEVIIEHCHANIGKAAMDEGYAWVYSKEVYEYGMNIWYGWQQNEMPADISKLRKAR